MRTHFLRSFTTSLRQTGVATDLARSCRSPQPQPGLAPKSDAARQTSTVKQSMDTPSKHVSPRPTTLSRAELLHRPRSAAVGNLTPELPPADPRRAGQVGREQYGVSIAYSDAEANSCHSRAPCRRKSSAVPGLKVGSSSGQMPAKTSPRHRPRERIRWTKRSRCLKTPGSPTRAQARQDRNRLKTPPALTRFLRRMGRSAHTPFFARCARGH